MADNDFYLLINIDCVLAIGRFFRGLAIIVELCHQILTITVIAYGLIIYMERKSDINLNINILLMTKTVKTLLRRSEVCDLNVKVVSDSA